MPDEGKQYLNVTGKVKWFNQFKGYGFIEVNGVGEDIFLHFSVVDKSGIERLNNNDVILCNLAKSTRGFQVTEILEIISLNKHAIPDNSNEVVMATMKWFNSAKGFGFAQMDSGDDVFIHSNLLKKHKLSSIEHGKVVTIMVRRTNFGYEAIELISE
jgi:CspA family cold shock protein